MVIGMSDADWKKPLESCETLRDKEDVGGDVRAKGPRSNHRVILGVLEDIVAYEKSEVGYCKEAHEDLYADNGHLVGHSRKSHRFKGRR